MIDEGIYALLKADSGIGALVGDRIFAVEGPDDAAQMPYLVYSFVGGSPQPTLNTSGVIRQRVQFDAYAYQPASGLQPGTVAAKIRAAVIAALDRWQAALTDGTHVLDAVLLNPGTDFCSEQRIYRCMCEFYVHYTLPTN